MINYCFRNTALLVLCCALPILLIAIGLSSMGAFLIGKQVWIFGSVLLIVGLIMLVKRRGSRNTCQSDCCHYKFSETEEKGSDLKSILFFKRFYYRSHYCKPLRCGISNGTNIVILISGIYISYYWGLVRVAYFDN